MKKLNLTISIMIVMALMAGSVFAAEDVDRADNDKKPQFHRMRGQAGMQQGRMMGRGRGGAGGRGMGGGRMGHGGGGRGIAAILRLADELELSKAQRDELSELATAHKKNAIKQRAEIELARVDLPKLMKQDDPDMDAMRDQLMKIATLRVDMKCQQIQFRIDSRNVLTEEQQEGLKKILKEKPAQGMRGRRRAGKPGPRPQSGEHRG